MPSAAPAEAVSGVSPATRWVRMCVYGRLGKPAAAAHPFPANLEPVAGAFPAVFFHDPGQMTGPPPHLERTRPRRIQRLSQPHTDSAPQWRVCNPRSRFEDGPKKGRLTVSRASTNPRGGGGTTPEGRLGSRRSGAPRAAPGLRRADRDARREGTIHGQVTQRNKEVCRGQVSH